MALSRGEASAISAIGRESEHETGCVEEERFGAVNQEGSLGESFELRPELNSETNFLKFLKKDYDDLSLGKLKKPRESKSKREGSAEERMASVHSEAEQEAAAAAWRAERTQKNCLHSDKPDKDKAKVCLSVYLVMSFETFPISPHTPFATPPSLFPNYNLHIYPVLSILQACKIPWKDWNIYKSFRPY